MAKNRKQEIPNETLIKNYRDTGDEYWAERLFKENDGLAHHAVKKFPIHGLDTEERAQIARFGMVKALRSFNLDAGVLFATYAMRCMTNELLMTMRKEKRRKKVECGMSLDAPAYSGEDGHDLLLVDMMESASAQDDFEGMMNNDTIEHIRSILPLLLKGNQLKVMSYYIDHPDAKQREIGEHFGLSQSYVTRIINGAFKRIKDYIDTAPRVHKKPEKEKEVVTMTYEKTVPKGVTIPSGGADVVEEIKAASRVEAEYTFSMHNATRADVEAIVGIILHQIKEAPLATYSLYLTFKDGTKKAQ